MDFLRQFLVVVIPVLCWIHNCKGECQNVVIENTVFQFQTKGGYSLVKHELCHGKVVYKKDIGIKTFYIYFVDNSAFTGWMVGSKVCENMGLLACRDEASLPTEVTAVWEEVDFLLHTWTTSPSIRVTCDVLSPQTIAGIAVGVFGAALTTLALCWCIYLKCKKNYKRSADSESHSNDGENYAQCSQSDCTQTPAYSYNNHGYTGNPGMDMNMMPVPPTYEEAMATGLFYTQNSGNFASEPNATENNLTNSNDTSSTLNHGGLENNQCPNNSGCIQAHSMNPTGQPQLASIEQPESDCLDNTFTNQENRRATTVLRHDVTTLPENPPPYDSIAREKTIGDSKIDNKPNSIEN